MHFRKPSGLRLIAVGRMRDAAELALFSRYAARLTPRLELTEIPDAPTPARENAGLRAALPDRAFVVALHPAGVALGSTEFAAKLRDWQGLQPQLCFVIGGAAGLEGATLQRCGFRLSLGAMTWPHMLARVMLAEQLYRAQSIAAGHPYHRG